MNSVVSDRVGPYAVQTSLRSMTAVLGLAELLASVVVRDDGLGIMEFHFNEYVLQIE